MTKVFFTFSATSDSYTPAVMSSFRIRESKNRWRLRRLLNLFLFIGTFSIAYVFEHKKSQKISFWDKKSLPLLHDKL